MAVAKVLDFTTDANGQISAHKGLDAHTASGHAIIFQHKRHFQIVEVIGEFSPIVVPLTAFPDFGGFNISEGMTYLNPR